MLKLTVFISGDLEKKYRRRAEIAHQLVNLDPAEETKKALRAEFEALSFELRIESDIAVRTSFAIRHANENRKTLRPHLSLVGSGQLAPGGLNGNGGL